MTESLRELADKNGFILGAAAVPKAVETEPTYAETLSSQFNCLVAENCMKAQFLQPAPGQFDFKEADKLVSFAEANGMKLRGHTLIWHNQIPHWLKVDMSRAQAMDHMRNHIFGVMEHFKGKVFAWDVVNEVLEDTFFSYREKSRWYELIGSDYVELAFKWARQADPDCKLFYNDYDLEAVDEKFDATMKLLHDLQDRNIPFDGVGFQFHSTAEHVLSMGKDEKFAARCERVQRELGLEVQITEMDLCLSSNPDDAELALQAQTYAHILRLALEAENCTALLTWGFTDKHSWIPTFHKGKYGHALLFDNKYQPKPAVAAMAEVLENIHCSNPIIS